MAYVVTDACIKDFVCVTECATASIAPQPTDDAAGNVSQVFINPDECIDCAVALHFARRTRSTLKPICLLTRLTSPKRTAPTSNRLSFGASQKPARFF